jgi:hypothetical protein
MMVCWDASRRNPFSIRAEGDIRPASDDLFKARQGEQCLACKRVPNIDSAVVPAVAMRVPSDWGSAATFAV